MKGGTNWYRYHKNWLGAKGPCLPVALSCLAPLIGVCVCPPLVSLAYEGLTGFPVAWQLQELLAVARSRLGRPEEGGSALK